MAKRRDSTTRRMNNAEKKYKGTFGDKPRNEHIKDANRGIDRNREALGYKPLSPGKDWRDQNGIIAHREGSMRLVGRRGVRARARDARIRERKRNGTYVAPGNSGIKKGSGS